MIATTRPIGAPGIYESAPSPIHALTKERMDIAAFVGVAPRGPSNVPTFDARWAPKPTREGATVVRSVVVMVDSFVEYEAIFGGFEGPGRLPYAVWTYFRNGGRRAYIVRVVPPVDRSTPRDGVARGVLSGARTTAAQPLWLRARDEGRWGNGIGAHLRTTTRPLPLRTDGTTLDAIALPLDANLPIGAHVRFEVPGGPREVRTIVRRRDEWSEATRTRSSLAELSAPLPALPTFCEVLEGRLLVTYEGHEVEVLEGLGFGAEHPRFLARALVESSRWLYPAQWAHDGVAWKDVAWDEASLDVDVDGVSGDVERLGDGQDRYGEIVFDDFFSGWVPADTAPGDGVHALAELADLASIVVPDLYVPAELKPRGVEPTGSLAGPEFETCRTPVGRIVYAVSDIVARSAPNLTAGAVGTYADGTPLTVVEDRFGVFSTIGWLHVRGVGALGHQLVGWVRRLDTIATGGIAPSTVGLPGLVLQPGADFEAIVALQRRLAEFATLLAGPIVLLDVPPRSSTSRIERWRARFDSAFVAAYHPWLRIPIDKDGRDEAVLVNPSAVAAGMIARKELDVGITHGPANMVAVDAVDLGEPLPAGTTDRLHPIGVNVFERDRDGIRLVGARTLSLDVAYRQLSVRRLMTMIERALRRQMQWMVFEPNTERTWRDVRATLTAFLRQLHRARAFRGRSEREAFFVRCDASLNDRRRTDRGELVVEVGVAPAEPIEFIVLRIVRGADASLRVEG